MLSAIICIERAMKQKDIDKTVKSPIECKEAV